MTVDSFVGPISAYPQGTILTWTQPLSEIPRGWALCDGNNGTPNLLGKTPKSVPDGTTDPGGTGGQDTFTMGTAQLPSHSHSLSNFQSVGDHTHNPEVGGQGADGSGTSGALEASTGSVQTTTNGSHSHDIGITNAGGNSTIENRPPYEGHAFIMKL